MVKRMISQLSVLAVLIVSWQPAPRKRNISM